MSGPQPTDWLAVDAVVNGTKLRLKSLQDRRMVVRRMVHKLLDNDSNYDPHKHVTSDELGYRMGVTGRSVDRAKAALPPAVQQVCAVCGETCWVLRDGTVEEHPDSLLMDCPASRRPCVEGDWEAWAALTVVWLAQRLRAGDVRGVWWHLRRLRKARTELLIVALAAVPAGGDPFAWLKDTLDEDSLSGETGAVSA